GGRGSARAAPAAPPAPAAAPAPGRGRRWVGPGLLIRRPAAVGGRRSRRSVPRRGRVRPGLGGRRTGIRGRTGTRPRIGGGSGPGRDGARPVGDGPLGLVVHVVLPSLSGTSERKGARALRGGARLARDRLQHTMRGLPAPGGVPVSERGRRRRRPVAAAWPRFTSRRAPGSPALPVILGGSGASGAPEHPASTSSVAAAPIRATVSPPQPCGTAVTNDSNA